MPAGASQIIGGGTSYPHFFAIYPNGNVWSWGASADGSDGKGYPPGGRINFAPGQVPIGSVVSIAGGSDHTLFLLSDHSVYAVGSSEDGALGNPSYSSSFVYTIVPVRGLPSDIVAIAAGRLSSFALSADGTVWVWGSNTWGQHGDGTTNPDAFVVPVRVPGLSGVTAIAAGGTRATALKGDGTVWQWGTYVGTGGLSALSPSQVSGLTGVTSLATEGSDGGRHAAITTDGKLWTWDDGTTPAPVSGLGSVEEAASVSSTTLALRTDGTVVSIGQNNLGQLGNGTYVDSSVATRVKYLPKAVAVATTGKTGSALADVPAPPIGGPVTITEMSGGGNPAEGPVNVSQHHCGDPVNTANGDFHETCTDLAIAGRGLPLSLERTYSSLAAANNGLLGYGWSFSYGMALKTVDASTVSISQENGSQVTFTNNAGTWSAPPRVLAALRKNADGTWTYTRRAQTIFTFDATGRLISQQDLNGYTTTIAYPSASSMVVTDPGGRTLTFAISGGHITSAVDSATPARHVDYGYDADGNLTSITDVGGGVTRLTYDTAHHVLTKRTPRYDGDTTTAPTPVVTNEYDATGRVTKQTDALGKATTFAYTADTTTVTDPVGHVTYDEYRYGQLIASTVAYGTAKAATSTYYYDTSLLAQVGACDPNGRCTTSDYDAAGNVLSTTDPLGRTTTWTYDSLNDVTSVTDPKGIKTTSTYDAAGNLLTTSTPLFDSGGATVATSTVTYGYGNTTPVKPGDVTSITDPNGKVSQLRYDAYGNKISQTAPPTPENANGNKTTWTYDTGTGYQQTEVSPKGNLSGATASAYTTTTLRDAFGNPTEIRDPLWSSATPDKHRQRFHYDKDQNLDYSVDASGNRTDLAYDPAGRLIRIDRPGGTTLRKSYWPDGRLKTETDGKGNDTSYAYNERNQLSTVTNPLGKVAKSTYDAAGNLTSQSGYGGDCDFYVTCAFYTYDEADQLKSVDYTSGSTGSVSNLTYDADGHRLTMTDATGTSTQTWDSLGRLTSSKDGNANQVSYGYDIAGNQTSITYPGSLVLTRHFDAANRIDWLQDWKTNKTTFAYDANSNLTTTTTPSTNGVVDTNTYDNADALLTSATKKGTTNLATFTYTRDGSAQAASLTTTGISAPTENYTYSALQQLKASGSSSTPTPYSYDAADNLTARGPNSTLAYDAGNQLCWQATSTIANPSCATTPTGATTFTYDDQGNRLTRTPATGTATSYSYDDVGRLRTIGTTNSYTYDGDGLRLKKTVSGAVKKFAWDRSTSIPMLLADADLKYVYGPDGTPLEQITPGGTVTYLHHDALGSTRLLTSSAGANVGTYNYDPQGATTTRTGTVTTPLQYAGQYTDAESGLQYLRARYYDPATAQFLTRDPAEAYSHQPYAYANNNPANLTDPTGLIFGIPGTPSIGEIGSAISNAAAGALDGLTGGLSTQIAGKVFGFNPACADFGAGFGTGQFIGKYTPWGRVGRLGAAAGRAAVERRAAAGSRTAVSFGHGDRHLAGTGLAKGDVESAIEQQVRTSTAGASVTGPFRGRVDVDGRTIEYRGHPTGNGGINVGTYYPPRP